MSCGNPHDTDCREVIEKVYLYLDGEMQDEDTIDIREHLDECSPCLRKYGIEQEVRALVARSCEGDRAPQALRAKVLGRLRKVMVKTTIVEYRVD